jgi:hypothetical protein
MTKLLHYSLSTKILNMAFSVHNILGPGLVESAYEEGYCVELRHSGIPFERQKVFCATCMDALVVGSRHPWLRRHFPHPVGRRGAHGCGYFVDVN